MESSTLSPRPALAAGFGEAAWLDAAGRLETLDGRSAATRALAEQPLVCHVPSTFRRLGMPSAPCFDVLELYAFVRPASFCLPNPAGLALALGLAMPNRPSLGDLAQVLARTRLALLRELSTLEKRRRRIIGLARMMARAGWTWGPEVLAALGAGDHAHANAGLAVWEDLPEWQDIGPEPPPSDLPVEEMEIRRRLAEALGEGAEQRPQQGDYAGALAPAFGPRQAEDQPNFILAEAGTGVGKTLGYLSPALAWAERNNGPVWISTYTRHLQNQIDQELSRLYPNPAVKAQKVVLRKGRENYICLLNLADLAGQLGRTQDALALGLVARWVMETRDGDLVGGDFPGWLADLIGASRIGQLADRRGECVHSACPQYGRCFVERSIRRSRSAEIVIANHALVMIQAALGPEEQRLPTRYVFDEGHHLFEAMDSAFAAHLTGRETVELRRWLIGSEGEKRSRARGLERRVNDLILDDARAIEFVREIRARAGVLPEEGWTQRVQEGRPRGQCEDFLCSVRSEVLARAPAESGGYDLEIDPRPVASPVLEAARALDQALAGLQAPLRGLAKALIDRLDRDADVLEPNQRLRLDTLARGIRRRSEAEIAAWRSMLQALEGAGPEEFVDWFALERIEGREIDIGYYRHWLDPTVPFAEAVAKPAHGLVVTSATLTDGASEGSWDAAEARTGASHLGRPAIRVSVASPFDYAAQTRVMIVTDVRKDDANQVAAAYRELFKAAGGGALGLFTAIQRLRAVHRLIAPELQAAGYDLLAQHVDAMNTATLIDIFRGERDACLLGTDAVRDGVDVPGAALRLIVFDRVPWPRPSLLHRARRSPLGGSEYDERLVRLKLKQAFGRLIRRADDHGVFVMLDSATPSRLLRAFPESVTPRRVGLAEAIAVTAGFLERYRAS
jgi:ATP-dependent DNA helicase DinG